jgi:hypothetical protein
MLCHNGGKRTTTIFLYWRGKRTTNICSDWALTRLSHLNW